MTGSDLRFRAAALWITAGLVLTVPGLTASARPVTHTVVMDGTRFEPQTLRVRPGDVVVWVNKDPFPHTVTAQSGAFGSKNIAPGKSWTYVPRKTGVFPYTCTLHPTMKATFRVE
ncbi:cupredoxin domain-containing protein [Cupriavidus necator]